MGFGGFSDEREGRVKRVRTHPENNIRGLIVSRYHLVFTEPLDIPSSEC